MKLKRILLFIIFFIINFSVYGQSDSIEYKNNLVKVIGSYEGRYGFITGFEKKDKENILYFIMISSDINHLNKDITVIFSGNSDPNKSERLEVIKIDQYKIGIYKVIANHMMETRYFQAIDIIEKASYKTFRDGRKPISNEFRAYITSFELLKPKTDENPDIEAITFETKAQIGVSGMPIMNPKGDVIGIIAENQEDNTFTIKVLDMLTIREKLSKIVKRTESECKYFSIIQQGLKKDETPCEKAKRLEEEKKELKDKLAKLALLSDSATKSQKKTYRENKDYRVTLSGGGSGNINYWFFTDGNGNLGSTIPTPVSYSYGLNLHINPDQRKLRITLKPHYSLYRGQPPENYQYSVTSGFNLKEVKLISYDFPILMEFVTKRSENKNKYLGIGYIFSHQERADIIFISKSQAYKTQSVYNLPSSSHKIMIEMGMESGKARISIFGSYQLSNSLNKDYKFVLEGESINPFRDVGKRYLTLGIDISFRLWGRWKNNFKTIF